MLFKALEPKIKEELKKLPELSQQTADPELIKNKKEYRKIVQHYTQLNELKSTYNAYLQTDQELDDAMEIQEHGDPEMKEIVEEEILNLKEKKETLFIKIRELLIPINPLDSKHVIMEIRAGTGGEEAGLFTADLFRMYSRYAEINKWNLEILNSNPTGIGGYKEIVFTISNPCYGILKYESGVHRVQRIPSTESGGRIHTSAVTVAVLPDIEETEIIINPEDIRIDFYRSSGPGGQSVNTTDSAVRVTHLPSRIVVVCQDEKSQHKNREKAMRVLRARITAYEEEKRQAEIDAQRKQQVGSGDRSERIRTYNYPQNRITDHRIQLTLYQLDRMMEGEIHSFLKKLCIEMQAE